MRPLIACVALCLLPAGAQAQPGNHIPHESLAEPPLKTQRTPIAQPPNPREETNVEYFWRKSDEAFHLGDYERAIGLHKAIVALDPGDVESYGVGAWLLWSLGRGDEAVEFIGRGLKANPDDWEMWNEAGVQYDFQKRLREAQEAYAQALQLMPKEENSQMLRRRLAHAAEKAGDFKMAVETWRALANDFPNEVVNKNNLARVERLQKEPEQNKTPESQKGS
ncbi:MAG: tetratricopeptide repeat protein [Armatimonadota bacterium]|nr:tetratricopeptide repeat protein [Armatimonadota bacterium]